MQKKRPNRRENRQMRRHMAAMSLVLVMLLGLGAFFVNSRYVFRYGIEGIKLDKYESGTDPIDSTEDPDSSVPVPEGSFRVHINHLPTYDSDNQTYNLQIWNPSNNQYLMRVKLVSSADKVLYSSDQPDSSDQDGEYVEDFCQCHGPAPHEESAKQTEDWHHPFSMWDGDMVYEEDIPQDSAKSYAGLVEKNVFSGVCPVGKVRDDAETTDK